MSWPLCGWLGGVVILTLCSVILGLLAAHIGRTNGDNREILEAIQGLNNSASIGGPTCVCNVTLDPVPCDDAGLADVTYCDVVIAGAGPAGVYAAYRLAPHHTVCLIDSRDRIGGKVYTYENGNLSTPTHAEQLRMSDTIGRCWYQELGIHSWIRGTVGTYYEGFTRNRNWTAPVCNDATMPPAGMADCVWGYSHERVAPNGDLDPHTFYQMENPCGADDWRDCSIEDWFYWYLWSAPTPGNDVSFQQFVIDTLGQEGYAYLRAAAGAEDLWDQPHSAKYRMDYDDYDWSQGYRGLVVPDGGPHSALRAALGHILGNGSSLYLGETVSEIRDVASDDAVHSMEVVTTLRRFRARRVIFAAPPYFAAQLKGDMGGSIAHDPHVTYGMHTEACTWNGFFETKWWQPTRSQCLDGYCAFVSDYAINSFQRRGVTWSFTDASESTPIEFMQYLPTPEREEDNLLRVWVRPSYCGLVNEILEQSGQAGVSAYILSYLHSRFDDNTTTVSGVVDAYFSHEPSAYSGLRVGVPFDYTQQAAWAKRPFVGRNLCLASEGYSTENAGWQEGAWRSVHRCFREQYLDTFTEQQIAGWESCCRSSTLPHCGMGCSAYDELTGCIDQHDPDTWGYCNRLDGEESLRDYYDYCYCTACTARRRKSDDDASPTETETPANAVNYTMRAIGRNGRFIWE